VRRVAVALLHFPVLDRSGQEITTAITNLDVHDIARSAYTYGIERYFVVHPIAAQRQLVERVRDHWVHGAGRLRIPDRQFPMRAVDVVADLAAASAAWGENESLEVWTTSANAHSAAVDHSDARALLRRPGSKVLLVFGTGWGLAPRVHASAALCLGPIPSPRADGYNHLSVRAASAIIFDRLLSDRAGSFDMRSPREEPA
jgi:hypothetical protein